MVAFTRALLAALPLLGAMLPSSANAQQSPMAALATLPECAINCFLKIIPQSPCSLSNTTCICTDPVIWKQGPDCLLKACQPKQLLVVKNATATMCGEPVHNVATHFPAFVIALGSVATMCVALRFWVRLTMLKRPPGPEDWTVLLSLLCAVGLWIVVIVGIFNNGLGKDAWAVPPEYLPRFGFWLFLAQPFYFSAMALFKISLLFFYLPIFRPLKRLLWATIIFNVLYLVTYVFLSTFQCNPVSYFWRQFELDPSVKGQCINIKIEVLSHACISIVVDIWMLALPLSQLRGLQMHWKKKAGVACMFLVGTGITVISIARLKSIIDFSNSDNVTYNDYDAGMWTILETDVGIICACMPALRTLLVRMWPVLSGSARRSRAQSMGQQGGRGIGGGGGDGLPGGGRGSAKAKAKSLWSFGSTVYGGDTGNRTRPNSFGPVEPQAEAQTHDQAERNGCHSCEMRGPAVGSGPGCEGISCQRSYSVASTPRSGDGSDVEQPAQMAEVISGHELHRH